jgi:hypothetical protein
MALDLAFLLPAASDAPLPFGGSFFFAAPFFPADGGGAGGFFFSAGVVMGVFDLADADNNLRDVTMGVWQGVARDSLWFQPTLYNLRAGHPWGGQPTAPMAVFNPLGPHAVRL